MPSIHADPPTVNADQVLRAFRRILDGLDDDCTLDLHYHPDAEAFLIFAPTARPSGAWGGLRPRGVRRWMSLNRPPYYWMRPCVGKAVRGKADFSAVAESQLVLLQTGPRRYVVLLPLVAGDGRATLHGDLDHKDALQLVWTGPERASGDADVSAGDAAASAGAGGTAAGEPTPVLLVAEGREPYALIHACMTLLREQLGTFRLAEEKPFLAPDTLGWCTWDAFYHDVSAEKVLAGLQSFRDTGVPVGWCILDDGWLHHEREQLLTFRPDPAKFPGGLAPVIAQAKAEGLVELFGVWHTFHGYWCGIHPEGELGRRYRTVRNTGNIRPWNPNDRYELALVHPDDAARFFSDFHGYLREQGVDLVKVDGQSGTEVFTRGVLPRVATMRTLQQAAQASALLHFQGRLLHCMAHASDVLFNLLGTSLYRNSDDFYPKRPHSHGRHMFENALNAYLTHTLGTPDWDMFWSAHPEGSFHAAARALSGGPVYVSDPPGQHDASLLKSLLDDRGHLLRPARAGLPTSESLFRDVCNGEGLLLLTNVTDGGHLLVGAFNCVPRPEPRARTPQPLVAAVRPADVPEYDGEEMVAYLHRRDTTRVLRGDDASIEVALGPLEWEIVTLAPLLLRKVAALGLQDKLLGAAAVATQGQLGKSSAVFHFTSGGTAVFYATCKPRQVDLRGLTHHAPRNGEVRYDGKRKRLYIDLPPLSESHVILTF